MPRKDGYQACREIREWEARLDKEEEKENKHKMKQPQQQQQQYLRHRQMPIIALSANVMSDVQEKCVQAGFSAYVTKPVDFIELSNALSKYF